MKKEANKNLAIIPARKGSKRFPGKNKADFNGKPLILTTIEAALESGSFDTIIVSSDDAELAAVAEEAGVQFHLREEEFSGDDVTLGVFLNEFLREKKFGGFQNVAVLLPTCPLRNARHIIEAFSVLPPQPTFLASVTEYEFPPQFSLRVDKEKNVEITHPEFLGRSTQKQSVETLYHANGAIFILPVKEFLEQGTFYGKPMKAYVMPRESSVDIDYPHQLDLANVYFKKQKQ